MEDGAFVEKTENIKKKKKLLNNNFVRLLLAIILMCGCAALGAGIAIYEDKSNPTEYVAEYFGKFLMQKYDEMYEYVDKEGKCIPKTAYVNLMAELYEKNNVGEYEFNEPEKVGDRYLVKITYKDAETGEEDDFKIYLVQDRKSATQLVADWKISIDEYLVEDVSVRVPHGMQLEIDGTIIDENSAVISKEGLDFIQTAEGETIVINKELEEDTDDEFTVFKFDKILKGKHKFRVLTDYAQIERDVDVQVKSQTTTFEASKIAIKDNYLSLIETKSPEMIKQYYDAVREKKTSTKKLLKYFKDDSKLEKKLKKLAKKDIEVIFWPEIEDIGDYSLIEYNFSELKPTAEYVGGNQFKVTYKFSYDYLLSTSTELYSSYVEMLSGNCTTTMELIYDAEGDDIIISDISIKNKNKKAIEEEE